MISAWKLKRHPVPMQAFFRHCLVVTYALPSDCLKPLLPPGLELDTFGEFGFVAIALVRVEAMRAKGLPAALGIDCTLTGFRIFTRFTTPAGARWRGLRILRSETNNRLIKWGGNRLTHYNYHQCRADVVSDNGSLGFKSRAEDGLQLDINARIERPAETLPRGSVFPDFLQARRFAGPLPFTFDYEPQSHSIICIKGNRPDWNPMPVEVDVKQCDFLQQTPFANAAPILSNAFYVKDIAYSWERGTAYPLPGTAS